ncbi:MAG: hypothetical protein CMJ18_24465, partial [Phycisphaeraceae bacterium]|nr:hypothetical protein [Phycisphaeraceae bacterium]
PASSFAAATADGRLNPPNVLAYGAGIDKIHRSGFRKEPANLVHAGEVAGGLGIYNLALYTVQEDLRREGTPHDTVDRLDLDRLGRQFVEAGALLGAVADAPGLSQRSAIPSWYRTYQTEFRGDHRAHGLSVVGRRPGSTVSGAPMAGAIVQLYPFREQFRVRHFDFLEKKISAFDDFQVLRTDRNGTFEVGPVDQVADSNTWWSAHAFDDRGAVTHANTLACRTGNLLRIEMFRARGGRIICPPVPALKPGQILDAWTRSPLDPQRSYFQTADGVVFWYVPDTIGAVEVFGIDSVVALRAQGEGEGGAPAGRDVDGLERAARDLWTFNEERLAVLRERQVANDSVEQLHAAAEDLIRAGAGAESVSASGALAASAFMAQGRVYHKIRGTFDDLVLTVVILLSLTVPFAFALERLVIGASTIYRQIAGFIGIFALAFLIVMLTHPAFALAATPIVIFLGFSVVVLSAAVIVIIMRKFEVELKDLQGIATTVHAADVSRVGTVMAAMSMGISTMRRRPWRTALSMTTIILITFTILCFASFDTRIGVIRVPVVGPPGYAGVFVQRVGGRALEPDLYRVVRDRWAGAPGVIGVFARYGHASSDPTWPLVSRPDGSAPMAMQGLVGIEPGEMTQREDLAALLGASQAVSQDLVWMTHAVAERLGAVPGDPVLVSGEALRVGPILDAQRLTVATDMDGSTILPVDPGVGNDDLQDDAALSMRTQNWMAIPADQIIVVTAQVARRLGSALRSVSIYATDTGAATRIAEDAALMLPMPISATRRDGVHRHLLGTSLHTVGGFDLMVPLLMGALVIFATLLGSVADRQKEIYTFSALGLAPPHVAGLFFVEAMVYSIVGGLGGYIVALGVVKVLTPLGSIGPFRVPEMNHSSTNAVITLLIVMGTVLLSAIYPAVRASRSANPGILRQWQLPVPEGDRLDIVFPFTVSQWDAAGVVSFLREHFEQFADTGLGRFMARQVGLVRRDGAAPGLRARIALAPFDLGVTQQFELSTRASEIEGIDEVTIRIERTSGQPKDWRRLNRVLLDDIRRQFLIWRSLPQETMEVYRRRTLEDGV